MSFYEPSLMQRRVNTPALCPNCAKDQIRPILWSRLAWQVWAV
ncbi:unannotated protein [freshwater metagenome]|uniref:Unannotated protein n=1 Tax=freshwater metagenome TaxID=449393 RepID=A0A6J7UX13_9ZZZZ